VFVKGHVFFNKGDTADALYLVKRGTVISTVPEDEDEKSKSLTAGNILSRMLEGDKNKTKRGQQVILGEWMAGDVFGISALTGLQRMATVGSPSPPFL